MKPNEISHYKSLIKQDTANRILIKKLQLEKQALKQQLTLTDVVASVFCECDGVQDLHAMTGECRKCGKECDY